MSDQNLDVAFAGTTASVPLSQQFNTILAKALNGGGDTAEFFGYQTMMQQFLQWLNANPNAWTQSTDSQGNPVVFAMETFSGTPVACTLMIAPTSTSQSPSPGADEGGDLPSSFTFDGKNYNVVGVASTQLTINGVSFYAGNTLVGSTTTLGIGLFSKLALPLLKAFKNGVVRVVSSCFGVATDAEAVAAGNAAAAAAAEGFEIEGVVVATAATPLIFIAMVALFAIAVASYFLLHYSYQNLSVLNLTPYNLRWDPPFMAHGTMSAAPMQAANNYLQTIPAVSNQAPPGITPVPMATQDQFSFQSSSTMSSLGYVMPVAVLDPKTGTQYQVAAVLFDVPWAGDNSLWAQFSGSSFSNSQLEDIYSKRAGTKENTAFYSEGSFTAGGAQQTIKVTLTFDYLDGEHSMPTGQQGYYYNSLLVFEMVS